MVRMNEEEKEQKLKEILDLSSQIQVLITKYNDLDSPNYIHYKLKVIRKDITTRIYTKEVIEKMRNALDPEKFYGELIKNMKPEGMK